MDKEKTAQDENPIIETIKTVVYALVLAGLFRTLFFQPFWIPSGSMKSTLLIGDFLFVNKMAYGYSYDLAPAFLLQISPLIKFADFSPATTNVSGQGNHSAAMWWCFVIPYMAQITSNALLACRGTRFK